MRSVVLLAVFVLASSIATGARAEEFLGIRAGWRLQDLRGHFPNAQFSDSKPAWLKPHQRLVSIAGAGIDGNLAVRLEHEVESTRLFAKELAIRQARGTLDSLQGLALQGLPERLERLEANPPVDPWEVKDVRWEPGSKVSLKTAINRYGPPDSDATDEQFRRLVEWSKRSISAYVGASESIDVFVYSFTMREHFCAMSNPPPTCSAPELPAASASRPARKK